jgi:RNA polymerase sigma-70 factor (ECF subfamily)
VVVTLSPAAAEVAAEEAPELASFEQVYAHYFRRIWRTLRRLGVAAAELDDATQDVFLVVYGKLAGFDGRSLRGWLYAIAVRVASDYRRGAKRSALPVSAALPAPVLDPARARELNESVETLHLLLEGLDEPKRTVFVLGELEELSAPEIADVLRVNLNTVYSRLRAARSAFEAALARQRAREERGVR